MLASWGYAYGPPRVVESGALEYLTHLRKLLDDRMLVLWGVGQRSEVIQGQKAGNGLRTGGSAATGAGCLWKISGGCRYEGTIGLSRCTDIVGAVGGIKEGILSCVCIVGSTDHAMGQTVYILREVSERCAR